MIPVRTVMRSACPGPFGRPALVEPDVAELHRLGRDPGHPQLVVIRADHPELAPPHERQADEHPPAAGGALDRPPEQLEQQPLDPEGQSPIRPGPGTVDRCYALAELRQRPCGAVDAGGPHVDTASRLSSFSNADRAWPTTWSMFRYW